MFVKTHSIWGLIKINTEQFHTIDSCNIGKVHGEMSFSISGCLCNSCRKLDVTLFNCWRIVSKFAADLIQTVFTHYCRKCCLAKLWRQFQLVLQAKQCLHVDAVDGVTSAHCNPATEYQCVSDGRCKLLSTWCDGTPDCVDQSDESSDCRQLLPSFVNHAC